ncbi:MAG: zinc-dependent metalloprotease [Rhodothermaceae bacterium]|nr:zinc-dependent metalloprotease [Rhodothermaceae bacterium]
MLKRFLVLVIFSLSTQHAVAQVCHVKGDHEHTLDRKNPFHVAVLRDAFFPKHIGLAFHILHKGGEENISLESIQKQVQVLNDAFSGTEFSFFLALVTRTENEDWISLSNEGVPSAPIRDALLVDPAHIINVFVGDMVNEAIGWSVFTDSPDPQSHAIVLDFVALPGGPFDPDFDAGITLVHEMGHYFSLRHPYERGCLPDADKGDFVGDTPPAVNSWFRQCPTAADSCPTLPGNDPVNNFMYATTDACRTVWTPGQIDRMQAKVIEFRPQIGGQDIDLPSNLTVASNSEWYFYEGRYRLPTAAQVSVEGSLYAEDVIFTSEESHWHGIHFSENSRGYLRGVEVTGIRTNVEEAGISVINAQAVFDSVLVNVLPESSAEVIKASGSESTLHLYQSYIIQNGNQATISANDSANVYFGQDSLVTGLGLNRIAGGQLSASTNGVIHAGNGPGEQSYNHFCDPSSSQLETSDGGMIYAAHNYWYNGIPPSFSGANILFSDNLGGSDCEDTPVVNVQVDRERPVLPDAYRLNNRPNPFTFSTTISFELPVAGHVHLIVYDMLGRPVKTPIDGHRVPGSYEIQLDASDLPSGTYITRLITEQGIATHFLSVVK